jgi:hypothetical protein
MLVALVVVGCVPPAPKYERCGNVGPFQCGMWTTGGDNGTSALGYASTTEPPTFIQIELSLEQQQPDGSWTGIWIDRSGLGSPTQRREWKSASIKCERGRYRWYMRVQFSGNRTTYTSLGQEMYMP